MKSDSGFGEEHHREYRDGHRDDDENVLLRQADCREDRVDREHHVDHHDLRDDSGHRARAGVYRLLLDVLLLL